MTILLFLVALELVALVWFVLDLAYRRLQARPWSARWIIVTNPDDDSAFWIDTWGEHDDIELIRNAAVPQGTMYIMPKDWQPIVETDLTVEKLWTPGSIDPTWRLQMSLYMQPKPDPKATFKITGA